MSNNLYRSLYSAVQKPPRVNRERVKLSALLHKMNYEENPLDPDIYTRMLDLCSRLRALPEGALIHEHIVKCKMKRDPFLVTQLIKMYGKCGRPSRAMRCFEQLFTKRTSTWAAVIMACAENGHTVMAREFFRRMLEKPMQPDKDCYLAVLDGCAGEEALAEGRDIHYRILVSGLGVETALSNALISMYARCGSLKLALKVFNKMGERQNVFSWISIIAAYAQNGDREGASHFFHLLLLEGVMRPGKLNFVRMLKKCNNRAAAARGKVIHRCVKLSEFDADPDVSAALIKMYGKCRKLREARKVFDDVKTPDVHLWCAMLRAYAEQRAKEKAVELFEEMKKKRIRPTQEVCLTALSACTSFEDCKMLHASLVHNGWGMGKVMRALIVRKYKICREVVDAMGKFRQLNARFKMKAY